MHNCWVYITNGLQDKASFVHARMGNHQLGRVQYEIVVKDDIQIQDTRAESNPTPLSSDGLLDRLGFIQQCMGRERCADMQGGIDEPVLIQVVHRLGFVKLGLGHQFDRVVFAHKLDAAGAVLQRIAHVGAHRDVCVVIIHGVSIVHPGFGGQLPVIDEPGIPFEEDIMEPAAVCREVNFKQTAASGFQRDGRR